MKDSKFTPGPWRIERRQNTAVGPKSYEIRTSDGRFGFLIANVNYGSSDVASNADLIAKAPEMHEALKQAKEALANMLEDSDWHTNIEDAEKALDTINKLGL